MITYQDYERFLESGGKTIDFVLNVIKEHKNSGIKNSACR